MIRINLLEARPRSSDRLDSILSSGRSSTFISRREAILGALFLGLTVVILGVLVSRFSDTGEESEKALGSEQAQALDEAVPEPRAEDVPSRPSPESSSDSSEGDPNPGTEPPVDEIGADSNPGSESTARSAPATAAPAPPAAPRDPPAEQPALPSRAVTAVRATALADRVDVFLEMPNPPEVSSFRLENPPRLVFDIPGTLSTADSQRSQDVESPLIRRLRIAQNTLDPPLVRLVLEVGAKPAQAAVSTSAAGVSIHVTAAP